MPDRSKKKGVEEKVGLRMVEELIAQSKKREEGTAQRPAKMV